MLCLYVLPCKMNRLGNKKKWNTLTLREENICFLILHCIAKWNFISLPLEHVLCKMLEGLFCNWVLRLRALSTSHCHCYRSVLMRVSLICHMTCALEWNHCCIVRRTRCAKYFIINLPKKKEIQQQLGKWQLENEGVQR